MLELQHVTAGYRDHVVLRDVDLVVPEGSVVALLGPNGAGKTTLLRVASGLLSPSRGRLCLDGEDVVGWSPHRLARAGVCHVPEGRAIFPGLTVGDNLRLQSRGGSAGTGGRAEVEVPARLAERLGQRAGTLSGGEQQMLALARARRPNSRFVLLDEVSMGLAPNIVDDVYDYLRRLTSVGASLLLVEQYVDRALELADYVYVLRKGRIVFAGEPGQIGEELLTTSYLGA